MITEETEMGASALERFIREFLPEKKLERKYRQLELTAIAGVIIPAIDYIGYTVSLESIFEAFRRLSYPMSVIEPQHAGMSGQPYIDTNSHAIYIAVDTKQLRALPKIALGPQVSGKKPTGNKVQDLLSIFAGSIK